MARPRKGQRHRRSCQIGVRFTPAERTRLETAADKAGVSLTEYVRSQALEGRIVVRHVRSLAPDARERLRQLGFALNRLTRSAHTFRRLSTETPAIAQRAETLLVEIAPSGGDLDHWADDQLRRIGVNLAQLTRYGHPPELLSLQRLVESLLMELVAI